MCLVLEYCVLAILFLETGALQVFGQLKTTVVETRLNQ